MFSNRFVANFPPIVPVKNYENRLIFDEDMDKSLWPAFLGPPCSFVYCARVNCFSLLVYCFYKHAVFISFCCLFSSLLVCYLFVFSRFHSFS